MLSCFVFMVKAFSICNCFLHLTWHSIFMLLIRTCEISCVCMFLELLSVKWQINWHNNVMIAQALYVLFELLMSEILSKWERKFIDNINLVKFLFSVFFSYCCNNHVRRASRETIKVVWTIENSDKKISKNFCYFLTKLP